MKKLKWYWWVLIIAIIVIIILLILNSRKIVVKNIDWNNKTFDVYFKYKGQKQQLLGHKFDDGLALILTEDKDRYNFVVSDDGNRSRLYIADSQIADMANQIIFEKNINWSLKSINTIK